jgi:hypothetical protein
MTKLEIYGQLGLHLYVSLGVPRDLNPHVSKGRVASYVHAGDHWSAEPRGSGDEASGLLNEMYDGRVRGGTGAV